MLQIKRGATKPDLFFYDVRDENGSIIDLTLVKKIEVRGYRSGVAVWETARDITASGTPDGTCHMHWQSTDTTTTGRIHIELVVTFLDDSVAIIPDEDYFEVEVTKSLVAPA